MPPKRESSTSSHNDNNNTNTNNNTNINENLTTSSTNNASITAALQLLELTPGKKNVNTSTIAAASANALPVLLADTSAEQRSIAYQANAKLCRLVRKCPWMYDRNHHNYAKKHMLDKSWCKIARECNDSVASCKERWRNIRAAFARSINIYKTHSGPNRVKPYYLHKELSFLVKPMMEGRDKKDDFDETNEGGSGSVKDEENDEDDAGDEEDDETEEPTEMDDELADVTAEIKSAFEALNPDISIQAETRHQKLLRHNNNASNNDFESSGIFEPHTEFTTNSDAENEFHFPEVAMSQPEAENRMAHKLHKNSLKRPINPDTDTFENKRFKLSQTIHTTSENDIRFLEALLPDMALMNTRQKIVFKRKIYQTLEEVFENSNDFPNIEHNKLDTKSVSEPNINSMSGPYSHNYSIPASTQSQIRQTVLTVNSSTARNLINNIASLNEAELQKVNGFLQHSLRNHTTQARLNNSNNTPSSAAAKLMSSTPKITITKVTCPPPAALRNLALTTKPPSPCPATVSTTIHNPSAAVISSNVHSTTSSNPAKASTTQNGSNIQHKNSPWTQLLPITVKDEIEDVDII